jgi:FlaA1/EpsC-like NDP-sugar epimerase
VILRRLLAFLHDVFAAAIAWVLAFWLRFNLEVPPEYEELMLKLLPWVVVIHAAAFWALGLYRGLWRFASLPDLKRILIAAGLAALALPAALAFARLGTPVPRTAYVLTPLLLVLMMSGSRIAYRAWKEGHLGPLAKAEAVPVLVLGAGVAGANLIKELAASRERRVIGLLDDDPRKRGGEVMGVKVLGSIDAVRDVAPAIG